MVNNIICVEELFFYFYIILFYNYFLSNVLIKHWHHVENANITLCDVHT